MDTAILVLLWLGTICAIIPIVITAVASVRDSLIDSGFVSEDSDFGRRVRAHQRAPILRVLQELGITDEDKCRLKFAIHKKDNSGATRDSPASLLLVTLKRWTRPLEMGFTNPGTGNYYVDTMGAMYFEDNNHVPKLAVIMEDWIRFLVDVKIIEPFDFVISQKAGNNLLVRQSISLISSEIKPIFSKNATDKSRVKRTEPEHIHITDFEGLEAFIEKKKGHASGVRKYKGIAIDDNCTSGASLAEAIKHFNDFVLRNPELSLEPIDTAVVLFTVKHSGTEYIFKSKNINLHALLSLGPDEMREIYLLSEQQLIAEKESFKDGFACVVSQRFDQ